MAGGREAKVEREPRHRSAEKRRQERPSAPTSAAAEPATRLLALQRTHGNHALARGLRSRSGRVLQRRVTYFKADTETIDPPGLDVTNEMQGSGLFQDSQAEIANAVDAVLINSYKQRRSVATRITARLTPGVTTPSTRKNASGKIGQVGIDEFWIQRGLVETFEGGHLIPHFVVDANDASANEVESSINMVPMSRTTNIRGWARKEKQIKEKLATLPPGDSIEVTIPIQKDTYKVTVGNLAKRFGLELKDDDDEDVRLLLYSWIPDSIGPIAIKHLDSAMDTDSEGELSEVAEGELHRRQLAILRSGADVVDLLERHGFTLKRKLRKSLMKL
jgi:hypothetical protein